MNTLGRLYQKFIPGMEPYHRVRLLYRYWVVQLVVIALVGLFTSQVTSADTHIPSNPDELREAYDSAFQDMYQDPADLDKATSYLELAIAIGDLEGAVAALERMLLLAPNLPLSACSSVSCI